MAIRTTIDKAWIRRSVRPLYGPTQSTPKSSFLSADALPVPVWPGMVMRQVGGDTYTLASDDAHIPAGLCAVYIGGDGIDEVADSTIGALAIWVLGPDAEFEILGQPGSAGNSGPGALAGDWSAGTPENFVYFAGNDAGNDRGKLVPVGYTNRSTLPVARLISVNSPNSITIGGLAGRVSNS